MRIGIFSESYEPVMNGVSVSVATLIVELRKLGHEVYVFAPEYPGHKDEDSNVFRFPSVRTWLARDYPLAIPYLPHIANIVKRLKLDIIHTQTPFMLGWLGLKLGARFSIPVISTNHTQYVEYVHYFPYAPSTAAKSFLIGMMRRYYNQCGGVIVPSHPVSNMLTEYGVQTPIYVIPTGNALDTSRNDVARSAIRKKYGIPADARVLLYVGRLAQEKNLATLFTAFDRLSATHDNLYLLIVGGGPNESECRELVGKLPAADRIIFTGFIPREDLAEYYSSGDIFTFPSTTETQGLVLAEALRAGLPCVAVRAGGSPEMLVEGEDSLLSEDDSADFAGKIDVLLSNHALMEQFSIKAVENAARFSPQSMALRMLEAYGSVLSVSGSKVRQY